MTYMHMKGIMHEAAFPLLLSLALSSFVLRLDFYLWLEKNRPSPLKPLLIAESGFIIPQVFDLTVICVGVDLQSTCEYVLLFLKHVFKVLYVY